MRTVQEESFEEGLNELQVLLPIHWEDLALNKDKVPLDPIYDIYIDRERKGELIYVTVREDGDLIGYFIGFIAPGLHYKTCLTCTMDIFYIHPDHRKNGAGGMLFEFVEKKLKARGVQRWYCGSKNHKSTEWFFEKIGFKPIETYFSKWLGE